MAVLQCTQVLLYMLITNQDIISQTIKLFFYLFIFIFFGGGGGVKSKKDILLSAALVMCAHQSMQGVG